jgi:prepilin-type N-terminal cleavage/methylation domain-containing protein
MFRNKKAFSTIELMVVVIIVGILAVVSVPIYKNLKYKAITSEAQAGLGMFARDLKMLCAEYNRDHIGSIGELNALSPATYDHYCQAGVGEDGAKFTYFKQFYIVSMTDVQNFTLKATTLYSVDPPHRQVRMIVENGNVTWDEDLTSDEKKW